MDGWPLGKEKCRHGPCSVYFRRPSGHSAAEDLVWRTAHLQPSPAEPAVPARCSRHPRKATTRHRSVPPIHGYHPATPLPALPAHCWIVGHSVLPAAVELHCGHPTSQQTAEELCSLQRLLSKKGHPTHEHAIVREVPCWPKDPDYRNQTTQPPRNHVPEPIN